MVSMFSFSVAIIWLTISFGLISFLRRNTLFLVKYSTLLLFLSLILGVIRVVVPLDMPFAYVIRSREFLPHIQHLLESDIMPGLDVVRLGTFLLTIWAAGFAIIILKATHIFFSERKELKGYSIVEGERECRIASALGLDKANIIVTPDVAIPKVTGVFKAHIYLPVLTLSDASLAIIIKHEYQHFKSHDVLIKTFYLLLLALFWWNPVVHKFQKELDRLLELRCDSSVTKGMDNAAKLEYLGAILSVVKQAKKLESSEQALFTANLLETGAEEFLKQRFELILHEAIPRQKRALPFLAAAVVVLFLMSYMIIIQPATFPSEAEREGGMPIDSANAYILVQADGTMILYSNEEYVWIVEENQLHDEFHSGLPIYYEGEK